MSGDAWLTLAVIVGMVAGVASRRLSPPTAVTGATSTLFVLGVIEGEEALAGLANPVPVTIAGLYVVAGVVSRTGVLAWIVQLLMGDASGRRRSLARLLVPSAGASAFLANTPIIAMLVPAVVQWSTAHRISPSRFLLPLSYATILGGSLTLIGTSTNLIAAGLAEESGVGDITMFDPARIGFPMVLIGMAVLLVASPLLVRERRAVESEEEDAGDRPEFTVVATVDPDGPFVGATVADAGLRHLDAVYLVAIERDDTTISPVAPDRRLSAGDHLVFVGEAERAADLVELDGLHVETGLSPRELLDGGVYEVVVGPSSSLVGLTVRDAGFRARHQAAVVAIHRAGHRIASKLGSVRVRVGDALLLRTGPDFRPDSAEARRDFIVVSALRANGSHASRGQMAVAVAALVFVFVAPAFEVMSLLRAVAVAVGGLVVARTIRPRQVFELVDLGVVVMIASAFGLGQAVASSGLADEVAAGITSATSGMGTFGVVLGLLLAVMILTELVTNAAAVALLFPPAISLAADLSLDPLVLVTGVAVAASASFLTPIGYQTNTMVWGPGRYQLSDYLRLGLPLWLTAWFSTATTVVWLG